MLPRPYVGSYSGEKVTIFQEPWIIPLAQSVEAFFMFSISGIPTVQYSLNLGSSLDNAKEKIPRQCRIGATCFTSLSTIVVNLFTRNPKNINHVHKDSNNILSVIIILGTNYHGGKTFFYDGVNMSDILKKAHSLKHSHGRCVVGALDNKIHEG